mmetsp:Transcript_9295/g.23143  ORF Transcript_9295/g.23143 Transcript_9295/m.23143 type:complete len:224 (+) Transcript_9295:411-1082(+)
MIQSHRKRLDRLQVEVVRRLVEQKDMRLSPRELREGEAGLLPAREELDRVEREIAREAEAAEVLARLLHRHAFLGEVAHVVDGRLLGVHHLDVVLRELGDDQLGVPADVPLGRLDLAGEKLEEGRLPRAVGPDNRHARLAVQPEVAVTVERLPLLVPEGDVVHGDARRRQGGGRREVEFEVRVVEVDFARLVLQLGEHLHPRLRLLRHLLVALAEALDELLEV